MEILKIQGTEETPKVTFDPDKDIFEFSGRSLPEDVNEFYNPVLKWINEYLENPNEKTVFVFRLDYFNTASSKILVEVFTLLDQKYNEGVDVEIEWYCPEEDEDILDSGEEFAENVDMPFNVIVIPE